LVVAFCFGRLLAGMFAALCVIGGVGQVGLNSREGNTVDHTTKNKIIDVAQTLGLMAAAGFCFTFGVWLAAVLLFAVA
jgi:hypothetical protein